MEGSDVFISYSRKDREIARALAEALAARGWRVWWDWNLVGGADFRREIQAALERSAKAIVLWSRNSIDSAFVLDEAGLALTGRKLVPISIDGSAPPLGFGAIHTLTLGDLARDMPAIEAALRGDPPPAPAAPPQPARARPGRRAVLAGGAVAALLAGAGGWFAYERRRGGSAPRPRIALVVGAAAYRNLPRLNNTLNDARAVSEALAARGFRVMEALEPTGAELRDAVGRFRTLLALGGVGLFYFAGTAVHIDGRDLIFPVDCGPVANEAEAFAAALDVTELTGPLDRLFAAGPAASLAGLVVIGKDGSRAPVEGAAEAPAPVPSGRRAEADQGAILVYAASAGEVAFDAARPGAEHSPFAEAFLAELEAGDASLGALGKGVRRRVQALTDGAQNPVLEDRSLADFAFGDPARDPEGVLRIVMIDACRDNPFRPAGPGQTTPDAAKADR